MSDQTADAGLNPTDGEEPVSAITKKWMRVDPGTAARSDLGPGRGSLLRAFNAWGDRAKRSIVAPMPEVERRREGDRHENLECTAWVGWKAWRRFQMNDALLVNLSRGGAQIFLDAAPPSTRPLWVFLETPGQKAIIKGHLKEVSATGQGQYSIRLEFDEPCPFALFEAAVCGLAPSNPRNRVATTPRTTVGVPHRRSVAG